MLRGNLFILLLTLTQAVFSQGWIASGAKSNSMANATVADSDVWSFYHNPGALGYQKQVAVGATYENRFLLRELQNQALVYVQPMKVGVLSVGLQSYGYRVYRTNRFGVGYAMKLHEKIAMGVQLNYQDARIEGYDYVNTLTAEVGILAKINSKINIGFSVLNMNRAKAAEFSDDRFGTYIRLGLKYQISSLVGLYLEAEKEIESKIRPKVGVDYQLVKQFYFRLGAAYNPPEITFGVGYHSKIGLKLDIGSAWRQHLGWSPHFGLTFHFKEKVNEQSN